MLAMNTTKTAETRTFKPHPKLLMDVIQRQAGSLSKATQEGIMNSVDAGATRCDVTLTPDSLTIVDDGKGFRSRQEIELFFETFGQPHDESERKVYGTFRMGRGQMFSFGHNDWQTGNFHMVVDIKEQGLDYTLQEHAASIHKGCKITVRLYERLMPRAMADTISDVERICKYLSIPLFLNGKQVNVDPASEKWDVVTDDAYIRLRGDESLSVYNLGVLVKDFNSYSIGSGGVVVARKQLKVNFARNDIMATCPVWRKIKPVVDQRAKEKSVRKPTLSDHERHNLIWRLRHGEIDLAELEDVKLLTDCSGRHYTIKEARNAIVGSFDSKLTFDESGSRQGDKVHQQKLAFVFSGKCVERFGDIKKMVDLLQWSYMRNGITPIERVAKGISSTYEILDDKELGTSQRTLLEMLRSSSYYVAHAAGCNSSSVTGKRKICAGKSAVALAWTNGSDYIAFDRKYLGECGLDFDGVLQAHMTLLHEYCHDSDSAGTHVHGVEFYQRFHDGVDKVVTIAWREYAGLANRMQTQINAAGRGIVTFLDRTEKAKAKADALAAKEADEQKAKAGLAALEAVHKAVKSGKAFRIVFDDSQPTPVADAQPVVAEPAAVEPEPEPVAVAAKATPPPAAPKASGSPWSKGLYLALFEAGSAGMVERSELVASVAKATGKTEAQVKMALSIMGGKHRDNPGKSHLVKDGSKVMLVAGAAPGP